MELIDRKIIKCGIFALFFALILSVGGGHSAQALNIKQQSLTVSDKSPTITINDAGVTAGNFKITPDLEFNRLNDFITYKLTINNQDGKKYKIVSITDNNTNDAINLSYTYPTKLDTADKSIEITIKYVKIATAPLQSITATIKLIDEDNNTQNVNVETNNSNILAATGDNIIAIISCILISLLALVLYTLYLIKNKANKKSTKLPKIITAAILVFGLVPAIVIAATSKDIQFIIEFGNIKFNGPYIVTFNTNTQDTIPSQTINHNELATKPTDPIKNGYTFVNWLDESNTPYDFTKPVTKNINLTANYNIINYQLNLNLDGGTAGTPANPITYTYETNDITLTNPTKDHYDFAGWITPTDNTPHLTVTIPKNSTGNKSYIATWTEKSYTVTFDTNGGTPTPQTQTIKYQQYATKPTTNPSKNGYNFKGWQLNNADYNFTTTEITGDITLTANYEAIKYTINYNLNGGTEPTPANPTEYTIETPDFTLTNPTKPNVAFAGWTTPEDNTLRKSVTITQGSTGDKTFIANYKPAYTVTYDTNGGDPITPSTFLVGENDQIGTLIDATKDHYDFVGWYIGTTPIDETYEVTGDIIITAHYTPHKYTITYNLNGGTETTNPTEYTIETPDFPLAEPTPPSTDKRFKGWTTPTNNTPTKSVTISQGTTGDLIFTAVYDDRHLVTFDPDSNYGTMPDADKTRYVWDGEQIGTLPANPTVTHPLKQFDCWGVNNTCINDNYTVTDDTTVVAIYKDKTTVNVIDDQKGTEVHDPNLCTKNSYVTNLDPAGNLRYVGACPKNYVWFNCDVSKYTGDLAELQQMDEDEYNAATCERWRIIGTFNVSNGTKTEKRVKLIRDESIGTFRQRNADYRIVQWDWTNSYDVLVNHYTKTPASGSTDEQITAFYNQTYNTGGGTHYYKNNLRQGGLDLIEQTVFYTGYPASTVNAATNFANIYNNERNKDINYSLAFINNSGYDDGRASGNIRWTGLVGLANLSDWAYSSSGGNSASDRGCLDVYNGTSWSNNNCNANSWIPQTLTMNPTSENSEKNARHTNAIIKYNNNMTPYAPNDTAKSNYYAAMRPVVFLKSNVRTGSGTGSYSDPFTLSVDE